MRPEQTLSSRICRFRTQVIDDSLMSNLLWKKPASVEGHEVGLTGNHVHRIGWQLSRSKVQSIVDRWPRHPDSRIRLNTRYARIFSEGSAEQRGW